MLTPYDWQEGIGHRASYVESKIRAGIPVLAASVPDGILMATFRFQTNKIAEIYDRIGFSGIGHQSDIEALRVASIEFCHQEGFRRSEDDVTVQRLVARLSEPVKSAFADLNKAPIVARSVFCEVNQNLADDRFYSLDYDADFHRLPGVAIVAGSPEAESAIEAALGGYDFSKAGQSEALAKLRDSVLAGMDPSGELGAAGQLPEVTFESVLLSRDAGRARRFVRLSPTDD